MAALKKNYFQVSSNLSWFQFKKDMSVLTFTAYQIENLGF